MASKRTHSNPKSVEEHMQRRNADGLSVRKIAKEFGTSKSTVHRKLTILKGATNVT